MHDRAKTFSVLPSVLVGLTPSEHPYAVAVLNELVHELGSYVENRYKAYADLFMATMQEQDSAKQQRGGRKAARGPSPQKLRQKRENIQKHLNEMYGMFAYGEVAEPRIRKPRTNLATAVRGVAGRG